MGGPRELESILGEGDPSVDLGQQFDVPPATVVQDQIVGGHEGSVFRDALEPEEAEGLAEGAAAGGKESAPVDADAFIRGSEAFDVLISTLDDDEVPLEDKLVAIKDFLINVRRLLDAEKVSYPDGFSKIPVIAEIIREDVDLAGQYQHEVEQTEVFEGNGRAAQILKDALEEVNTPEWVNKPPQERVNFLIGHLNTASASAQGRTNQVPEFRTVENFIKDLQGLLLEEADGNNSGMPVRPEKVGLFTRIGNWIGVGGWLEETRAKKERAEIEGKIEESYGKYLKHVNDPDTTWQQQIDILRDSIRNAQEIAGGADWVMSCRSVVDANRGIEARKEAISKEIQEQIEAAGIPDTPPEDRSGRIMDAEVIGSGPAPFAKPNNSRKNKGVAELEASAKPEDSVEVSSSDEAVSPPVESIRINAAPNAEATAAQAPSPEVVNQEAELAPAEEDEDVDNEESKPGVTVESAAAPASVDSKAEALANPAEVFAVGLRNAFRKLQESRTSKTDGKPEKITSGEAYARFKDLLAEEIANFKFPKEVVKQVLQETFDKEGRRAIRVILGMALRELGVMVKMKDGELSTFDRVKK